MIQRRDIAILFYQNRTATGSGEIKHPLTNLLFNMVVGHAPYDERPRQVGRPRVIRRRPQMTVVERAEAIGMLKMAREPKKTVSDSSLSQTPDQGKGFTFRSSDAEVHQSDSFKQNTLRESQP